MPRRDPSFWYTLGRTVETAVSTLPGVGSEGPSSGRFPGVRALDERANGGPLPGILAGAATAFATSRLSKWTGKRRPRLQRLLRGAVAGAGAAGVVLAARFLLERRDEDGTEDPSEVTDELLAGAGRGVLYAGLIDPYLPGPPIVRGAMAGTLEYLAAPWGGLYSLLRPLSPVRKVPVVSVLLETGDAEDDPYVAFLLYGIMVGLFYGGGDED